MKTIIYFFVVIFMATIFLFCKTDIASKQGEELAQIYCGTCHLFPSPDILDQQTWKTYILPRMGAMMGYYSKGLERDSLLGEAGNRRLLLDAGIYPEYPIIRKEEWQKIQQFYLEQAPVVLQSDSFPIIIEATNLFKVNYPDLFLSPPSTTYTSIDANKIIFADANKKIFFEINQNYTIEKQATLGEGVVHFQEDKNTIWATVMGSFSPTELPNGYILKLDKNNNQPPQKIINSLQRPVHSTYADFNNDNQKDILISEFGKWTGKLSLHSQNKNGTYTKTILMNRPGAIRTESLDYNHDRLLDFIALFGQGNEEIILFINQGANQFKTKSLLRFHPSMGSSYFTLYDWNQDGKQDIIYTAGDNADYPPLLKPYHGIYIYLQKENFTFEQQYFLPLHGAYKAIPFDFDNDFDIDIAAISFFPDYQKTSPRDFVFFENVENKLIPKTINLKNKGRWITLDNGDIDQDGDEDLILGALTFEVPGHPTLVNTWVKEGLPFVFLENLKK